MTTIFKLLSAVLFIGIAGSLSLYAKDVKKDTAKGKEIVVTGLRYAESLIELPMSVTVLKGEDLLFNRGFGAEEVLNKVPGVLAQTRAGGTDMRLTIRGFGARGAGDRSNSGTSRGIKILLDGLPMTEPDGRTSFDLLDIDNASKIEIIRSNLSSVWGNAAGGVINISTIPTNPKDFIQFDLQNGSFGYQKYGLSAAAILDFGKAYLQVSNTDYDGFRANSEGSRFLINAGLVSAISNKTMLDVHLTATQNKFNIPGPLTQAIFDSAYTSANELYLTRKERRNNTLGRLGVNLVHNFNENNTLQFSSFAETKFLERSERNTYRNFLRYHIGASVSYKNEMQITDDIKNTVLIGFDEAYQDGGIMFFSLNAEKERGQLLTNKREGANTLGAYIQDEIQYGELSVFLGGRLDAVSYYSANYLDGGTFKNLPIDKKVFEKFIPRFGVNYRLDDNNSVFVSFGGGIEVPAANETDPTPEFGNDTIFIINPLLDPIISTTTEIGWKLFLPKSNWYNNFDLTFAAFNIDVVNDIVPYRGGRYYFTAGKTNRKGVELGLNIQTEMGIKFNSAFTFMSTEYTDYKIDSAFTSPKTPGKFAVYNGNKIAGIPSNNFFISLGYVAKALNDLEVSLNVNSISNYFVDDANKVEVPSFTTLGFRLQTGTLLNISENMPLSLYANVSNITDAKYAASAFVNPDLLNGEPIYLEPGMPRNFMIGLKIRVQ